MGVGVWGGLGEKGGWGALGNGGLGGPGWRGWGLVWGRGLWQEVGEGKQPVKGAGCSGWDEYGGWGWHLGYLNNLSNLKKLNNLNPAHLNDLDYANFLLFKSGQRI